MAAGQVRWGGVADDFTGATDLATNWVARGLRTSVTLGVPSDEQLADLRLAGMDAVVVALKTRTAPVADAVRQSVAALDALRRLGCERFYDKYCSTFDSTPAGNIGPVADALAAELGADKVVVVPSFPATGRTVYQGHLFVGGQLLSESSMRHHPLTPMTDSDVAALLRPQTAHRVATVPLQTVRAGAAALRAAIDAAEGTYVVVDALDESDLAIIAEVTSGDPLVTGGSGLALGLPAVADAPATDAMPVTAGHRAVLAGSASSATRGQIADAREKLAHRKLDLAALRADLPGEVARLTDWARECWTLAPGEPVLVYAVDSLDDLEKAPPAGERPASEVVEEALAGCATAFAEAGARQFLVAGGETSGSVVQALDVQRLELGPSLAPGVSWAHGTAADGRAYNLALKSGNFGHRDIFTAGWQALA
ncbi:3-oxo-tetronate kinase [Streptomyces xiamenensis]